MVSIPRVVIAAPASGHGKTTVATGLLAAFARELMSHRVTGSVTVGLLHATEAPRPILLARETGAG